MTDFEKMGLFYLGKDLDNKEDLCLLPSKELTTHAVCMGMTGSGKTGLGIALLEEAGLDKIPALIIDPKGDVTNLMLTFPGLTPEEFKPWCEGDAAECAKKWEKGLKEWGEDRTRIQKLRASVDISVYTPGSQAGIPLSILSSFAPPPKELQKDEEALRDRILSLTSSLLALLGRNLDPLKSREHILISTLIAQAWEKGESLDLSRLIGQVQNPPITRIGALDLQTFYPVKERKELAISLNNLLASPGFQVWMEGEPLDIQNLLYTKEGKPRLAILSIAHLNDQERMFFVTLLLSEFLSWMRRQSGTSSLRALLYMDEIFGFFPPTASPPSKLPMLTLLKQGRAFGVGVVLVTQNPVDLDYKGLSNCGTWFVGKLQTARDKARVLEGLKVASNGEIDGKKLDELLSQVGQRKFILQSIYLKKPLLFETRWTLSYLRGPLTLAQIATLTPEKHKGPSKRGGEERKEKMVAPIGMEELYLQNFSGKGVRYTPLALGKGKVHFVDAKSQLDIWKEVMLLAPFEEGRVMWQKGERAERLPFAKTPLPQATYDPLPPGLNAAVLAKELSSYLYQCEELQIYKSGKMISDGKESEEEFGLRVKMAEKEARDGAYAKIRAKYRKKIDALTVKMNRLQTKLAAARQKGAIEKADTALSFGSTILGALFGKKITGKTIAGAGGALRKAGRVLGKSRDVDALSAEYQRCSAELERLRKEMEEELAGNLSSFPITTVHLSPRKSDIAVEPVVLVWAPD